MEMRLPSNVFSSQTDQSNNNISSTIKTRKLFKINQFTSINNVDSFNPSVQFKRPFLRKNEGHGAWCSRLRQPLGKSNPKELDLTAFSSATSQNEFHKLATLGPIHNKPIKKDPENSFCYPFESTSRHLQPADTVGDSIELQDVMKNDSFTSDFKGSNDSNDRELEEFELLERLAENQGSDGGSKNVSVGREFNELPIILDAETCRHESETFPVENKNIHRDEEIFEPSSNRFHQVTDPSEVSKNLNYESYQSTSQNLSNDDYSHCDHLFSSEVGNVALVAKRNRANQQHSLPCVRFNVAGEHDEMLPTPENPINRDSDLVDDASNRASSAIKIWIARLEAEVNRFNAENAALSKLKAKREEALIALAKEKKDFEAYKESKIKEFETFREEEMGKLKKERKILTEFQKCLHSMPQRRDREEIERLKQQIFDEKAEAAQRESRLQHKLNRQRTRIEELSTEKTELLERIKRLERTRLTGQSTVAEEMANQTLKIDELSNNFRSRSHLNSISKSKSFPLCNELSENREINSGSNPGKTTHITYDSLLSDVVSFPSNGAKMEPHQSLPNCVPLIDGVMQSRENQVQKPPRSSRFTNDEDSTTCCLAFRASGRREASYLTRVPTIVEKSDYSTAITRNRESEELRSQTNEISTSYKSYLPGGMSVQTFPNGDKVISLPNGQKELHCAEFKRRIYPDGTVKTVFSDGQQETRYASGRIRIKDCSGNLLVDTRIPPRSQPSTGHFSTNLKALHLVTN